MTSFVCELTILHPYKIASYTNIGKISVHTAKYSELARYKIQKARPCVLATTWID